MKILTIIGVRPQFIKAAIVSRCLNKSEKNLTEIIVHTGQHYDDYMSEIFFKELAIPKPAYHLGIGGGTHGQNTGRMVEAIEQVMLDETPDWVLVYGDTDSTLAGALSAAKLHIPIAHIEAGLRSFNKKMPEEINRVLTDHISSLLFTPTIVANNNLEKEGISRHRIIYVGDVMYDAVLLYGALASKKSHILEQLDINTKNYILATVHRQENTDDRTRLKNIFDGLANSRQPVIMPIHPRTKNKLLEFNIKIASNLILIEPVGYMDMIMLQKNASLIATDSGGIQKEAYFYKIPCITLRDETEWTELVQYGANHITGSDVGKIAHFVEKIPNFPESIKDLYGDGSAGEKITDSLLTSGLL